ncbi:MAG: L-threonylcarbamoyladenylate synthase [Bacteroidetes bacterium]|nr:L-threonylcarbamoyladenylate synthase [Bacteroidota bacterium]
MDEQFSVELKNSLVCLGEGGLIVYPTDTVWGLGCDATNDAAVASLLKLKMKVQGQGLIILLDKPEKIKDYVKELDEQNIHKLTSLGKPLTLIFDDGHGVARQVLHENGSIAIRIPSDEFCRSLVIQLGKPIVSTSANLSMDTLPNSYSDISESILKGVDYVVNLRREKIMNSPSDIAKVQPDGSLEYIRI